MHKSSLLSDHSVLDEVSIYKFSVTRHFDKQYEDGLWPENEICILY